MGEDWKNTRDVYLPERPLEVSYINAACRFPLKYTTIWNEMQEAGRTNPDHVVFIDAETDIQITYKELTDKSRLYARALISLGVQRGDTVTLAGVPDVETIILFYAVTSIGAVFAKPYLYLPLEKYMPKIIKQLETVILIVGPGKDGEMFESLSRVFPSLSEKSHVTFPQAPSFKAVVAISQCELKDGVKTFEDALCMAKTVSEDVLSKRMKEVKPEDPAVILTSTGTTGDPKPIPHSQTSMVNWIYVYQMRRNLNKEDMVLAVQSSFDEDLLFVLALMCAACMWDKSTCVIAPWLRGKEGSTSIVVEAMAKYKCTHADLWPFIWEDIIHFDYMTKYNLTTLKGGMSGAQMMSLETVSRFTENVPEFVNMYGASECTSITCNFPDDDNRERRMRSVGYPMAHTQIKVIDEKGHVMPIGQIGEVLVRTPFRFLGYSKDPELTSQYLDENNWCHTGDMGYMDPDGFMYLVGRKVDRLRFKRLSDVVYPGVIEGAASQHPKVALAQCIGVMSDRQLGDEICVCVTVKKGKTLTESELQEHCESVLIERDHPTHYFIMEGFPRVGGRQKIPKWVVRKEIEAILADRAKKE